MSPSDSKRARFGRAGHGRPITPGEAGFSLMELMVTMVVAVILGVSVVRFYKDSYHTYSLQEQISDRNQNAHFILNKFVEILQQAGSSLPDTGWTVIKVTGGVMTVGINPRGAEQYIGIDMPWSSFIPVDDASQYANSGNPLLNTTHVLIEPADKTKPIQKLALDPTYNSGGFSNGIKDNATGLDSLRVATSIALSAGDKVYGYREDEYDLSSGDLVIRPNGDSSAQMVLAEDIDSVGFTFLNAAGTATTNWKLMRSASITVRARTETIDPKLSPPGYHKISLPMNVMLRNKL